MAAVLITVVYDGRKNKFLMKKKRTLRGKNYGVQPPVPPDFSCIPNQRFFWTIFPGGAFEKIGGGCFDYSSNFLRVCLTETLSGTSVCLDDKNAEIQTRLQLN